MRLAQVEFKVSPIYVQTTKVTKSVTIAAMWFLKQTFTTQLLMIMQIELPKISSDDDVICPPQHHLGAYVKLDKGFHSFLIS